jgi:hypothetical protein
MAIVLVPLMDSLERVPLVATAEHLYLISPVETLGGNSCCQALGSDDFSTEVSGVDECQAELFGCASIVIFDIAGDEDIGAPAFCRAQQGGAAATAEGHCAHRQGRSADVSDQSRAEVIPNSGRILCQWRRFCQYSDPAEAEPFTLVEERIQVKGRLFVGVSLPQGLGSFPDVGSAQEHLYP